MIERKISVGLSYMYEPGFNRAVLPLLQRGAVDALEWSFDTVSDPALLPDWQQGLLKAYADEDRLYGHGVYYGLLNAGTQGRQAEWLRRLERLQQTYRFRHLSEHFGFMSSQNAHEGCPLPLPLRAEALALGRRGLAALAQVAQCPVGIENLALAFSRRDVLEHGRFLEQLTAPAGGFIVLDLHNTYCQAHNFRIAMRELIRSYPLERVREIHLSGGSWAPSGNAGRDIRRDTHDDRIPHDVLAELPYAISACPNLDVVFVERLGATVEDDAAGAAFRDEYLQVRNIVQRAADARGVPAWPFRAAATDGSQPPLESSLLHQQQQALLRALGAAASAREAKAILVSNSVLAAWGPGEWDPAMIDTAMQLGRKWGLAPEDSAG